MALEKVLIGYDAETAAIKQKLTDLETNLKGVETAGKKSAKGVEDGFKETGKAIEGVDKKVNTFGKETLSKLSSMIVGAFAVERIMSFGQESVKAFRDAELATNKLAFAVEKIAKEGTGSFDRLIKQSKQLEKISIFSDDNIQNAQAALITFGLTSKEAEKLLPHILDLASVNGDLAGSTDTALRAIEGQTRGLKTVGASFDDTGSKTGNYNVLIEKLNKLQGETAIAFNTSAGQAKAFENQINNLQESLGSKLAPVIQNLKAGTLGFFDTLFSEDFLDAFSPLGIAAHNAKEEIKSLSKDVKDIGKEKVAEKKEAEFDVTKATIAELNKRLLLVKDGTTLGEQDLTESIKKELEKRQKDADKANEEAIKGVQDRKEKVKKIFEDEQIENAIARVEAAKQAEKDETKIFNDRNEKRIIESEAAIKSFEIEEKRKTELVKQESELRIQLAEAESNSKIAQVELFQQLSEIAKASFKESATAQKVFFLFNQALAVAEVFIKLQQELASIRAANAILGAAGIPITVAQSVRARLQAATSIGVIVAQTIPQFKKGGEIGGKPHSEGGTLIEAEKGEWITSVEKTRKYKEELTAIHSNRFEELIYKNYVIPEIKKAKLVQEQKDGVFNNISESLRLNGFDDYRLYKAIKKNSSVSINNTDELASKIAGSIKIKQSNKWT